MQTYSVGLHHFKNLGDNKHSQRFRPTWIKITTAIGKLHSQHVRLMTAKKQIVKMRPKSACKPNWNNKNNKPIWLFPTRNLTSTVHGFQISQQIRFICIQHFKPRFAENYDSSLAWNSKVCQCVITASAFKPYRYLFPPFLLVTIGLNSDLIGNVFV